MKSLKIPLGTLMPIIVVMDMLAVSLVVPLLHQYFLLSGVTSARQRELLSSIYSSSQILGGLALGMLSDSGVLSRKNTLLLSFVGSFIAYGIIAKGDMIFWSLVCSRVIVGFVKQTMTVSTAILTMHAKGNTSSNGDTATSDSLSKDKMQQTVIIGRIKASVTISWIVGPSLGAFLFKYVHISAPPFVACIIFSILFVFGYTFLPNDEVTKLQLQPKRNNSILQSFNLSSLKANFRSTFLKSSNNNDDNDDNDDNSKGNSNTSSKGKLFSVIVAQLLFTWITLATSYSNMASYYEERYGIEPHQRGYLSSYRALLSFIIQSVFIQPLLQKCGGRERYAAFIAALALAITSFLETKVPFSLFLILLCPLCMASTNLLEISIKSLVTQVAPSTSISSVLATLDVLQNIVKVTVPFYRASLFASMTKVCGVDDNCTMSGDPDPFFWNISSGLHWLLTAILLYVLLVKNNNDDSTAIAIIRKDKKNK